MRCTECQRRTAGLVARGEGLSVLVEIVVQFLGFGLVIRQEELSKPPPQVGNRPLMTKFLVLDAWTRD
jgi:hypothetical protein